MKKEAGITLIEMMVALLLSLVLMGGMIQLFIANKQSYKLSEAVARMQESARYAAQLLAKDVRMAGYSGCTSRDPGSVQINNQLNSGSLAASYTFEGGLEGWDRAGTSYGSYSAQNNSAVEQVNNHTASWASSTTAANLPDDVLSVTGSDMVAIWTVEDTDCIVLHMSGGAGTVIDVPTTCDIQEDDIVMITDCSVADVVQVTNVTDIGSGVTRHTISGQAHNPGPGNMAYVPNITEVGGMVFKLAGHLYYIGKRGDDANNPPALYRLQLDPDATGYRGFAPQELVEGVESMQLLYGEDTDSSIDGVADRYVDAGSVSNWRQVVSVRIQLLMQSEQTNLVDGSQTFHFNGVDVTASDGRLRFPYEATVSLRNRTQ